MTHIPDIGVFHEMNTFDLEGKRLVRFSWHTVDGRKAFLWADMDDKTEVEWTKTKIRGGMALEDSRTASWVEYMRWLTSNQAAFYEYRARLQQRIQEIDKALEALQDNGMQLTGIPS